MAEVNEIFEAELTAHGVVFSGPDAEGLYSVEQDAGRVTVSLANVARDYERDGDADAIRRFVGRVLAVFDVPAWAEAESLLFLSAEPADHDFGDTLRWTVSDLVSKVLVLTDLEEGRVTWVTPTMLADWGVSEAVALAAAEANMDGLLAGHAPELAGEVDGMHLAMIPVASVFKASTIFAPSFKSFISQALTWPVIVVIPCRDFIYALSETDSELLNRLGGVVQREYRESGYPISTEVFRLSDAGIEAIGKYPE